MQAINENKAAKVAVITGAARRIGAQIATTLHTNNYQVVLHFNTSATQAYDLALKLNKKRENSAIAVQADLSDIQQIQSLTESVRLHFGQINLLVNNASNFYKTEMGSVTFDHWFGLMEVNLRAPFFLTQAMLPYFSKNDANIINIVDIYASKPLKDHAVYCASKAGLAMMTTCLAKDLAPNIRVNAIAPGSIIWPEGSSALTDAEKEKIIAKTLLKRERKHYLLKSHLGLAHPSQ